MKKIALGVLLASGAIVAMPVEAAVTLTIGAGTAVTSVSATANFESTAELYGAYAENGLSFTRFNISENNNGCGYAGCGGAFPNFSGNYFYGTGGANGYLQVATTGGNVFSGLEFTASNGFGFDPMPVSWQAFLGGSLVGSGQTSVANGSVLGFGGDMFDTLTYAVQGYGSYSSPAMDTVSAQYAAAAVPEPASWAMMVGGFGLLGGALRRKKATVSFA